MIATRVCVDCYHFSVYLGFPTTFTEEHGIQFHASFLKSSFLVLEGQKLV